MAKTNGLGVRIYANGYDLNTDVNALSGVGTNQALLDTTALANAATARTIGLRDSTLTVNGWFDNATGFSHDAFSAISGDAEVIMTMGTSRGDSACGMVADQSSYNIDRSQGSAIATTVEFSTSDGEGLNWGVVLTDGPEQTDSSATNSASVDNSTSSSNGGIALISVESIGSGTATVKVQDSSDDAVWADLASFTAVTGRTSEAVSVSGSIDRYLRVQTTGTFTDISFVVQMTRL